MAAVAPQTTGAGAGAGGDWKSTLALPPRDTRVKTEVRMMGAGRGFPGQCVGARRLVPTVAAEGSG